MSLTEKSHVGQPDQAIDFLLLVIQGGRAALAGRHNGQQVHAPGLVFCVIVLRHSLFKQVSKTPGHGHAVAGDAALPCPGCTEEFGNRFTDTWFFCNNYFHGILFLITDALRLSKRKKPSDYTTIKWPFRFALRSLGSYKLLITSPTTKERISRHCCKY